MRIWLIILALIALAGFVVLGFFILNNDGNQQSTTLQGGVFLSAEEKAEEIRLTYADIGTVAHTETFEFTASKLDCSQSTLKALDSDDQITSKNGKFCIIDLAVKNVSEETQTFAASDALLRSVDFEMTRVESQILHRSDPELQIKIFGEQFGEIEPDKVMEGSLIFDLAREVVPYIVKVFDEPNESPATIYLDDWGNDGQFACRQPQELVVNQTAEDCGVSYRLDSLVCKQTLTVKKREFKACLADFTMTNISHQFREDSPYAPNFTYRGYSVFYAAFGNHNPYLVDEDNNWYSEAYSYNGELGYYDDELEQWQDLEIELPSGDDYLSYYDAYDQRSELSLAPGESIKSTLIFVVASDVAPANLYLDKRFYPYILSSSESLQSDIRSADSTVNDAISPSSDSSAPSGRCPTCGLREF